MAAFLDLKTVNEVFPLIFEFTRTVILAHARGHTIIARAPDGQETVLNELLIPTKKPLP